MKYLPLIFLLCGCSMYRTSRPVGSGRETTVVISFLTTGKASQVKSSTTDNQYKRTVSVGSVEAQTETEKLNGMLEAIAKGAVSGAK